jgi:hypothetical protein
VIGRDRNRPRTRDAAEVVLEAAAAAASWPATPDLRHGVLARISAGTPVVPASATGLTPARHALRREPSRLASGTRRSALRAVALALLALIAIAGAAAALGYRLPGLDIQFVESLPPAGSGLHLGSPVAVEELQGDQPRVLLPSALPAPAEAWVSGARDRRIVTLAWRAASGQPTLEHSDLSVLVMAVPGRADAALLTKALPPDARIEPVRVGDDRGWWISGGVHALLFHLPDGDAETLDTRLVGETLVFSRGGTLYRVESALGRDATIALAETMR